MVKRKKGRRKKINEHRLTLAQTSVSFLRQHNHDLQSCIAYTYFRSSETRISSTINVKKEKRIAIVNCEQKSE